MSDDETLELGLHLNVDANHVQRLINSESSARQCASQHQQQILKYRIHPCMRLLFVPQLSTNRDASKTKARDWSGCVSMGQNTRKSRQKLGCVLSWVRLVHGWHDKKTFESESLLDFDFDTVQSCLLTSLNLRTFLTGSWFTAQVSWKTFKNVR